MTADDGALHDLNDLRLFAAVVEHGGFSAAGRALNTPKSRLSKRIAPYYAALVLFVIAVALVLTSSNNGLALTGLGVAAFVVLLRDVRYLGRALAGLGVCLVLIFVWGSFWLPPSFEQRVLGAVRSGSLDAAGTFEDRVELMKAPPPRAT